MVFYMWWMQAIRNSRFTIPKSVWMHYKLRQSVKPTLTNEPDGLAVLEAGEFLSTRVVWIFTVSLYKGFAIDYIQRWLIETNCLPIPFQKFSELIWQTLCYYSSHWG